MVLLKADEKHFSKSRDFINGLRQNGTFCDVSLIVGSQVLKAHRCVLAAGSEYFNALFLGQFAEASMNEINLSEVTEDMSALEMMVNFLYTGEIEVNSDNLDTVVKLSSYFIMEMLLELCSKFIVDTLSLQTCLKYHICAMKHGLTSVTNKTTPMVRSRFHDFMIFEEEAIDISPEELLCLYQNEVFQFCTPHTVLKFVVDWVKHGLTEQHIAVGTEILDSMACVKDHTALPLIPLTEETKMHAACEEMIVTVSKARPAGHKEFVHHVSKLRNQCFQKREKSDSGSDVPVLPTANMPTSKGIEQENVLITLSPRQCVIDHFTSGNYRSEPHTRPYEEAVFDMCAYMPSTGRWYYIKAIDDQILCTIDLSMILEECTTESWLCNMRSDQLVFADIRFKKSNRMTLHSLNDGTWKEHNLKEHVNQSLQQKEAWHCPRFCMVKGNNDTLYMITVIRCWDKRSHWMLFCRCFKYNDRDESWEVVFQTEKYPTRLDDFLIGSLDEMLANINSISNEMLVMLFDTCKASRYRCIIFVVNLNSETLAPVSVLDTAESEAFNPCCDKVVGVVEGTEQLFILYEVWKDDRPSITVRYEYKYNSNKLMRVETGKKVLPEAHILLGKDTNLVGTPCLKEFSVTGGGSTWYLSGNRGTLSALTEFTVDQDRTPVFKSHAPPPFTCITAAFAGTVSKDVLKKFQPVSFLGKASK